MISQAKYAISDWLEVYERADGVDNAVAYLVGRNKFILGSPASSCPYSDPSQIRSDWLLGWADEREGVTIEQRCGL